MEFSRKTLTNLTQEPQINVSLLEPIATDTYDLGSSEYPWSEIYVNKNSVKNFPLVSVVPNAYGVTTATSPPADRASNGGMEYFVAAVSSSNFRVYRYIPTQTAAVEIFPQVGSLIFYTLSAGSGISYLAFRATTSSWVRIALNV